MDVDTFLKQYGLTWDELDTKGHSGEKQELLNRLDALRVDSTSTEDVKTYVQAMKRWVEMELTKQSEVSTSWLSALGLLIPLIGVIRKWYADKREVELRARLVIYVGLEDFLLSPDKKREQLDRDMKRMAKAKGH